MTEPVGRSTPRLQALVLIALGLCACAFETSPPPSESEPEPEPTCGSCHADIARTWASSHHALGARPAPDPAARHRPPGSDTDLSVVAHIGVAPLWQPVLALPDGRHQVSTTGFDAASGAAFEVVDPPAEPGAWGHWTGGALSWSSRCAPCHTSPAARHGRGDPDPADPDRRLGVTCTACHGDASAHSLAPSTPPPFPRPTTGALGSCGPCHARGLLLDDRIEPGDGLLDAAIPSLPDPAEGWFADGAVEAETFEAVPFLTSRHAVAGLTCTTCHDPHGATLRRPVPDLCMDCHSTTEPPPAHSIHAEVDDRAPGCVDCHLPSRRFMQRDDRHDHGLHIPDPWLAEQTGAPLACDGCHDASVRSDPRIRDVDGGRRAFATALTGAGTPLAGTEPIGRQAAAIAATSSEDPARRKALDDAHPLMRLAAVTHLDAARLQGPLGAGDPVPAVAMARRRALTTRQTPDEPALAPLRHWLSRPQATPGQLLELAAWADRWGQFGLTASATDRAVDLDPTSPAVRRQQAVVLARQGHLARAQALLQAARADAPVDFGILDALARIHHQLGEHDAALATMTRACAVATPADRVSCAIDRALILSAAGRLDAALAALPAGSEALPVRAAFLRDARRPEALRALCHEHAEVAPIARICATVSGPAPANDGDRSPPR